MEIFVHMPKRASDKRELERRVADIHSAAILDYLAARQDLPLDDKLALIKAVQTKLSAKK